MYSQLLYFIVALLLFTIQQPGSQPFRSPVETLLLAVAVFLVYVAVCRTSFLRLKASAMDEEAPLAALTLRYHRLQTRLSILALGAVAVCVFALNIKFYFQSIPGFNQSFTLSGLSGLLLYLLHLAVVWYYSHPIYRKIHRSDIRLLAFMRGHVAFSSAVLIPWLILTLVSDLLQWIKTPAFLGTDTGQFVVLAVVLILFVLFAPCMVVRLWGCQPLPSSQVREDLERFCGEHRFRVGNFLIWPLFGGEMLTAGVIGILPRWRYILVTKGLLTVLNIEELKAVVAHEMGHVRRYHLLLFLLFFLSYSLFTYSLNDVLLLFLLEHDIFRQWASSTDTLHATLFSLAYSLPVLLMLLVYFRFIFGFFLRNSERQADLFALRLVGHPYTLVSSLQKIAFYSGHIEDLPSWHHFSIRQRMSFLTEAFRSPHLVSQHDRKLYGAALVFLVVAAGLITGSFHLGETGVVKRWSLESQLKMIEREVERKPFDAELHGLYGGLLLELDRRREAEAAMQRALELAPDNATILNNLAWLYATSPPPHHNPPEALKLALRAASLDTQPHVLDTLAEAYFANEQYENAVEAIERALGKDPPNKKYYIEQKQKFEGALQGSVHRP